jgi:hypothetical protein
LECLLFTLAFRLGISILFNILRDLDAHGQKLLPLPRDSPIGDMVLHANNTEKDPNLGPEDRDPAGAGPERGPKEISEHQEIDFVTLGMFIIGKMQLLTHHSHKSIRDRS